MKGSMGERMGVVAPRGRRWGWSAPFLNRTQRKELGMAWGELDKVVIET